MWASSDFLASHLSGGSVWSLELKGIAYGWEFNQRHLRIAAEGEPGSADGRPGGGQGQGQAGSGEQLTIAGQVWLTE